MLSNGILVTFVLCLHSGDVDRIVIDKSLIGKMSVEAGNSGNNLIRCI